MALFPWRRGACEHESVSHSLTYESTCCAVYENNVVHNVSLLSPYKDPHVGPGDNTKATGKSYFSHAEISQRRSGVTWKLCIELLCWSCLFENKSPNIPWQTKKI